MLLTYLKKMIIENVVYMYTFCVFYLDIEVVSEDRDYNHWSNPFSDIWYSSVLTNSVRTYGDLDTCKHKSLSVLDVIFDSCKSPDYTHETIFDWYKYTYCISLRSSRFSARWYRLKNPRLSWVNILGNTVPDSLRSPSYLHN